MKKMLALLLVAVLAAACSAAYADTLEIVPGTPAACDIDTFMVYFGALTGASGYHFIFDAEPETEGDYLVYTAHTEDNLSSLRIYTVNGDYCYSECAGEITVSVTDTDAMNRFGEWIGAAFGGSVLSVYIAEGNPADNAAISTFNNDITPLLSALITGLSDETLLANGTVSISPILGYPSGIEVRGYVEGGSVTLKLRIVVTGADGQLIQK